jgi:uracil-DNA glycosylase family 4
MDPVLAEIIADTRALVQRAANAKRGTLTTSPEVARMLAAVTTLPPAAPLIAETTRVDAPATHEGESALEILAKEVSTCTKCPLCEKRKQTVFGDGSPHAKLVFVGEAPGEEEDRQGKPFVGRAGHLLTDIIEKGIRIPRSEVYICNVIKCRPPENRDPLPAEKEQCEPYLLRQLELIKPNVIVALGRHAAHTLLRTDESISKLRGKWHFYHGIPLRVTFHPAYLLRNPEDKTKCWEDIKHVIKVYRGEETPAAS